MLEMFIAACGSFVWVNILRLHYGKKPFACETCMAGWMAIITCIRYEWFLIPFLMAGAMCISILLTYIIKKI